MSEAITKALQLARDALANAGLVDHERNWAIYREAQVAISAALSQPAPAQQPAAPVDEQMTPSFAQLKQILDSLDRCHHRDSKAEFLRTWIRDWSENKVSRAILALRPAVEPMTLPPVEGDVLPAIGSKVLIHLASSDSWAEHEVVGYYVWEAINDLAKPRHHRVFVRVRDADGILNARHICDVHGITAKAEDTHQPTKEAGKTP